MLAIYLPGIQNRRWLISTRTDRIAKYKQLLRIEEELGTRVRFPGPSTLRAKQ